ncbi:SSI family serine proteinase inhibitor [Blastococcus sp. SYSU DS1024]
MRRLLLLGLLAWALVLGACATGRSDGDAAATADGGSATDGGGPSGASQAENELRIVVDRGDGTPPETWTLTCDGVVEGTHPRAEEACAHLEDMTEPFAPLPDDLVCTEQYGGPQTARITGRWEGEPVDLELSRVDGCRIAQWDALGPVLPVPVGEPATPLG